MPGLPIIGRPTPSGNQPLQRDVLSTNIAAAASPFSPQIDEIRSGLENRERFPPAVAVERSRGSVVRADRQELGFELLAGGMFTGRTS